jgi:hypothetical protein
LIEVRPAPSTIDVLSLTPKEKKMSRNSRFATKMLELKKQKEKELQRRGERAAELLKRSEEVIANKEQWEAYQVCIDFQHNRMTRLIHDILTIRSFLETFERRYVDGNSGTQKK